jgi:hypothetical protein
MKKQLLLFAGGATILISCNSNYKPSNTQLLIDSVVNARVAAHDAENARKNDSIINAQARIKAEAIQNELDQENKKKQDSKTQQSLKNPTPDSVRN